MNTKILTGMTGSSLERKIIILLMITKSKSLILSFQFCILFWGNDYL
ncbi:hypothetical protein [Staphylococcus aureus]|nr:hypothetical protein [Staphylococcus aureus]SUL79336.1 Uncharacterised protein [Staphylococcus aureus]